MNEKLFDLPEGPETLDPPAFEDWILLPAWVHELIYWLIRWYKSANKLEVLFG